jgi:dTMP kinase
MTGEETNKFRLVNIIGIDGAGKTTLAKALTKELQRQNHYIRYKYCQYFPKLLYPIKFLVKHSVMRKTDEFENYKYYNRTKKYISARFPVLANIYANVWLVDYIIQVFFKITLPLLSGQRLIIDRYIFDIAVNLSLTTNNNINYARRLIRFFFKFAPRPDLVVLIDLPEEDAFGRKDDIQDIEYLRERRKRYLSLADTYKFKIIDGKKNPKQVIQDANDIFVIDEAR